ncbi:MAG TPA: F0F1 ATP synthase subunit B [Pirellulales bacterium]|nr:F0F1 ATP synthase subunit B [Pirellulales bacterium]
MSRLRSIVVFLVVCVCAAAPVTLRAAEQGGEQHAGQEHAGEHGAGHGVHFGQEDVDLDPSELKGDLAIFTFVVFLLLVAILGKFAWGPISVGLERREHRIADQIAAAERANAEAKQMLVQYEQKLASAQDEVRLIIDEARRDATHTQQEILTQARADAAAEMDRAKREVETAKDQALRELAETSAKLAVDLASKILRAQLDANQHAQLVAEALSRFPNPSAN